MDNLRTAIAESSGDDLINECLRLTPIFSIFQFLLDKKQSGTNVDALFLRPNQCLFQASREELKARFTHYDTKQLEALVRDFEVENAKLDKAVKELGLEELFEQVYKAAVGNV